MISNNTTYKLKGSKSPSEVCNYDQNNTENSESVADGDPAEYNHRGPCYLREGKYRNNSSRNRITEFRPSTWSSERKVFKARGSGSRRDRDFSDSYRKYHDSGRNADITGSSYHSKFYESEKKNDIKPNLPEDTRISKLLRRLSMETDPDSSLSISKKLLEVLLLPDNASYIRKAFHILGESMFDILQVSPGPVAKKQAARALGRMGYIMAQENDFERYQNWLFGKMGSSYEELQILIVETLRETLYFERKSSVLQDHVDNLLRNIVSIIETTESAPLFKVLLDVLMTVVEIYPDNFFPLFRDTIDLLFGWHVDHAQPLSTIEFISTNLQRIPKHFQFYIDFSISLIENFLEDIVNYSKQLAESGESTFLEHITVLVLAMNTVLKCLGNSLHSNENKGVKPEFINTIAAQIIKTTTEALDSYIPENLTIATNDSVSILLTFLDTKPQTLTNNVYSLIDMEMSLVNEFCDATIVSLLVFISKILKELSANLPNELIEKLVGPKSELVKLRNSPFNNIQEAVISVYQALLNLKNVSLVQEAYRYILGDFEMIYLKILPNFKRFTLTNPFENVELDQSHEDLEKTAIFILRCLSQLSNASSIIAMWALKPSILELVALNLTPYDPYLAQNAPNLQYSLLYLLYSHCKCYMHYISTSSLIARNEESANMARFSISINDSLKDEVSHSSPNSGNFAIILDIIHKTLNTDAGYEVVLLLMQWIKDILNKSEVYLVNIYNKENFISITEMLVKCGYNLNEEIALEVCEILGKLLSNKHLPWSNSFLINVCDLCKLHICSNKTQIRNAYSKLASLIPWDVAVVEFNKINSINNTKHQNSTSKDYNSYMVTMAQYLHSTGTIYSELSSYQFKILMNFLLNDHNEKKNMNCLEEIFTSSISLDTESQMNMELFYDLGVNSKTVLYNWATLEAAQFCVNSRLRTPLGKPIETFTKIEGAFYSLGNDLLSIKKDKHNVKGLEITKARVTLLLQFVEHLEKRMYNAAEGCAVAMPQPPKLVRTFFIANSNTCNEWITRIRMVVMHISLHAADFSTTVRHGYALMKEMVAADKTKSADFEKCAIFLTLALLNQRETEAIYGLYVWCKSVQGKKRKYGWIKYACEQSAKKYETAIEGYKKVLSEMKQSEEQDEEDDMKKIDIEIQNFVHDQIEICLKEFYNWSHLLEWHNNPDNAKFEEIRKYSYYTNDWYCITNLVQLDEGIHELSYLSNWEINTQPKSWSCYNTLSTTENSLYQIAIQLSSDCMVENLQDKIDISLNLIETAIQDYQSVTPCEIFQQFSLLQYIANGLRNVLNNIPVNNVFLVSESFETEVSMIDSSILRKILWWSEYFGKIQNQGFNSFCSNLRLDIIKRARKEKNINLAYRHIYKFLKDKDLILNNEDPVHFNLANSIISKIPDINIWTTDISRAMTEVIKILFTKEENKHDIFNLCAATSTAISKYTELYGGPELRKISSKILLKLATWMQNNNFSMKDMNSPLGKLLLVLPDIAFVDNNSSGVIPLNEMAIGKLLQFSIHQCVTLAKGWSFFGTWCYKWGRKILGQGPNNSLSDEDCDSIKSLLPLDTTESELEEIFQILSQNRNITDEEDLDSNSIKTSVMIRNQLQNIRPLRNAADNLLADLLQMWRNTQKKIYSYYNLSAESYFKYLHLVANSENVTKSTECNTITITLRLLRLIVRYALELQGTLEEGLKATPTQPWKVIIPQLFSRLNHPESYVHHCVSDLLCRVAEDAPHLITFPAVVGALEGGVKFNFSEITLPKDCLSQVIEDNEEDDLNENEDEENDYESDVEEVTNAMQSSFKVLVDTLSKQDPETISQVQLLVRELRRITLLWDELWLGTLMQHHSEINKRQHQLEYEIEKVIDNPNITEEEKISLIAEKHRIVIKPIIFILEQLREVTSVEAETPHEKLFQEKFSVEIDEVIRKLKQPEAPEKPNESLLPLKNLQKKFQQKIHKRSAYSLKMQDISPVLANIRDTMIAMPGLTSSKTTVKISHISNVVSILPTKTKPKKLVFYGSDGQTYTYLFKGLEDLHLDERIMQFLSIANTMMAQNADPTGQNLYRARHYSVIPLGPRSGLISWVEGTTPIFSLYKRWQQREIAKPSTKNATNTTTTVLRPSDLFYNKLNPLLVEHGVKNIENRKEWPLSVLKQVLAELMIETPSDLLAREFWCNSVSASDWWNVTKRYSYSVAVMSIIGYIIGLGDRHLDNMLVDLTSGEVVHIDYNVCFEKGKTLRVPEKVPFRLTPNIRGALGATGVEGIFRLACENVVKTMRKGRETLLTLLEAFVYDPLIDWTVGGEVLAGSTFGNIPSVNNIKQSRRELEKEITISMFNVRCTEMKVEWSENKETILKEAEGLSQKLQKLLELDKIICEDEDALQDLHQQMALVKEAEAQGTNKHPLYSLPYKFDAYHKTKDALINARKDLQTLKAECEKHFQTYNEAVTVLGGPELISWVMELKNAFHQESGNVFDLVKEFLHNAGKDDVVAQCEESEAEIAQLTEHQNTTIQKCLQVLQEYKTLNDQCPKSYLETHRSFKYLQWINYLLANENMAACEMVYENFQHYLDTSGMSKFTIGFVVNLDGFYKEAASQMSKVYEELSMQTTDVATLDKLYTTARTGISTFLNCEKNADKAFEFVITSELLVLNRNFLTLETAAHRSGEWLIKLTSRDGDWFLDDLVLNSSRAVELINNLPLSPSEEHMLFYQISNCVRVSNNIYKGLHELYFNCHTIILPECMKKIQSEDPSLLQIISDLDNLIEGVGISIPDMIVQMVKILPCLLMQMEISNTFDYVLERVAMLKTNFMALMNGQETLSTGRMLLMGFNGLFEKLTMEWNNLINALNSINLPNSWKKIDQVKDAKNISAHISNPKVQALLEDIFLLKRLQAMSDFFNLCCDVCVSFKGVSSIAYNDEQLVKPIRQFIADFISRQLLGITTENIAYIVCYLLQDLGFDVVEEIEQRDIGAESKVPIDDLFHKAGNIFLKQGLFSQNALSQASTLESNLKHAWVKIQETKKLQQKLTLLQSTQIRLHGQVTVVNFMFEEILQSYNASNQVRTNLILNIKNEFSALQVIGEKLRAAEERQATLIESANQRLNWAKGANPEVGEILSAFENSVQRRNNQLKVLQQVTEKISNLCASILRHLLLRSHSVESKALDKAFVSGYEKWRMACQFNGVKQDTLTPIEENIMLLLTKESVDDPMWLEKISEKITSTIKDAQAKLSDRRVDLFVVKDSIMMDLELMRKHYASHMRLMSDVKNLIKSMSRIEEYAEDAQRFIVDYKIYLDNFTALLHRFKKDYGKEEALEAIKFLTYVREYTEKIFDDLHALETGRKRDLARNEPCSSVNSTVDESLISKQDSVTSRGQQRNAYAVGVWRRVKMKLEGRDPDSGRKYSAQEQIDYVIREATSHDNLALLYEGWTPWV